VPRFIKVGNVFLNLDQVVEVQNQSTGDGASCHVWLSDGRSHGFKDADAQSVLDAMVLQTTGRPVIPDEFPLP
jgi:ribosomal protein S4E